MKSRTNMNQFELGPIVHIRSKNITNENVTKIIRFYIKTMYFSKRINCEISQIGMNN